MAMMVHQLRMAIRMATAVFQLRQIVVGASMMIVEVGSCPGSPGLLYGGGGHDLFQLKHPIVALYCSSQFPMSKFRQSILCQRNHKTIYM